MKVIQLPDVLYEYLVRTIEAHGARGIHPEEGLALNRLWDAVVNRVTTIPDADLQKSRPLSPEQEETNRVRVEAGGPTSVPECGECFEEEGSYACVRSAHQVTKKAAQ